MGVFVLRKLIESHKFNRLVVEDEDPLKSNEFYRARIVRAFRVFGVTKSLFRWPLVTKIIWMGFGARHVVAKTTNVS